jgi:hypothetical protein
VLSWVLALVVMTTPLKSSLYHSMYFFNNYA